MCKGYGELDYVYVQGMGYFTMMVNFIYGKYVLIGLENYVKMRIFE